MVKNSELSYSLAELEIFREGRTHHMWKDRLAGRPASIV